MEWYRRACPDCITAWNDTEEHVQTLYIIAWNDTEEQAQTIYITAWNDTEEHVQTILLHGMIQKEEIIDFWKITKKKIHWMGLRKTMQWDLIFHSNGFK